MKLDKQSFRFDTSIGVISRTFKYQMGLPLRDLTLSTAILELRIIPAPYLDSFPILSIQFHKDSAILEEWHRRTESAKIEFKSDKDSTSSSHSKANAPLIEKKHEFYWEMDKKRLTKQQISLLLSEVVERNIFNKTIDDLIEDTYNRIAKDTLFLELVKRGLVQHSKPIYRNSMVVEIKFHNKYRTFRTGMINFYYYDSKHGLKLIQIAKFEGDLFKRVIDLLSEKK